MKHNWVDVVVKLIFMVGYPAGIIMLGIIIYNEFYPLGFLDKSKEQITIILPTGQYRCERIE